jgi:polysaccharide export outer membrane protein
MPVRNRGSLLAGVAALLGLWNAGCQSRPLNADAMAVRPAPASAPRPSLFSFRRTTPPAAPLSAQAPEAARPTPVVLQPVPPAYAPERREVIASTWQPVQRVSAEQAGPGPDPGAITLAARPPEVTRVGAPNPFEAPPPPLPSTVPPPIASAVPGDPALGAAPPNDPIAVTPLPAPRLVPHPLLHHGAAHGHPVPPEGPVPRECAKEALPPYVIEPPDILLVESSAPKLDQPIAGQHLVRPDGTIELGIYGTVFVAGMTLEQAKAAIVAQLSKRLKEVSIRNTNVDVLAYNSKFYYVITDGGGYGEQIYRVPLTGNETVLDGLSQILGLPAVASKHRIWLVRPEAPGAAVCKAFPVDYPGITRWGLTATNYQLLAGDRIYVEANPLITLDTALARLFSPLERVFGVTLLGSATVHSIAVPLGSTSTGTGF